MASRVQTVAPISIAAPISGWKRLLGDWILVSSSTAICHALGVVTGLTLRMVLSPAQIGIFSALKLFISYGNYANLGISKGAVREFNVATGHGVTERARQGLNLAFTVNTISSLLYASILLIIAGLIVTDGGPWSRTWALGFVAVAALTVVGRFTTFHVTILRASQKFNVTSQLSILEAILTLTVCVVAAWYWGLPGLLVGTVIVSLGAFAFMLCHAEAKLRWAWERAEIRRLISIGAPILLAGAVSTLFRSLDKLMILGFFSDREFQLGCYSAALMVSTPLFGFGNMLAMVSGPRYGQMFGQSGDYLSVARLALRASELQAAAIVLPAAIALVIAPIVFTRLLPDYASGLAPLNWLVPGVVALALVLPGSQYLIAVGQQRRNLVAVLIATGLGALGNMVVLHYGYGLVGVAAATSAGYTTYFLLVTALSLWPQMTVSQRFQYSLIIFIILMPILSTALFLQNTQLNTSITSIIAIILVWSLSVAAVWKMGGWSEYWKLQSE